MIASINTYLDAMSAGISWYEVASVALCLLLSAALCSAETALMALSEAKSKELVAAGRSAGFLRMWMDKPHHLLTAALIGNHAANVGVAVVATLVMERTFHSFGVSALVAVGVVVLLVIGELVPRSFAKTHAVAVAPVLLPVVVAAYVLLWPAVQAFTRISELMVRLTGGAVTRSGPFVTEDDIVSMIQLGSKVGVLDKQEGKMLASIIDLNQTLVREVMMPRTEISALPISATADEVLTEVKEKGHSRMPVYDDTLDEVKGFFHTKDLLNMMAQKRPFNLKEHLRPVLFVPELMRVSDLLKLFQKKKTHLAVVVDEYGGTAGIVAFEDVLEEIVGPIQDEHDDEHASFKKIDDNRFVAEGRSGLYEIGEAIGVTFPADQGYETLGGFLIARTGRMPLRGDRVLLQGWAFTVREADEKRVARVEIVRAPQNAPIVASAGTETTLPTTSPDDGDAHASASGDKHADDAIARGPT